MIVVREPELTVRGSATRVTARIDIPGFETREIWFEGSDEAGSFLSERGDAFAAALLPVANALGERLEVRGVVSPRLAWGLRELLRIRRLWWPRSSRPVELVFPRLEEARERGTAVGCGFSGGVDSLFSLFRHLPRSERTAGYAVTHMVMINGFDLDNDLRDPGWFDALRSFYRPLAEAQGLQLSTIRTNMGALIKLGIGMNPYEWLGALLATPALAMSRGFSRYYVGSAEGYGGLGAYGSSPLTDPWFSTDTFQLIHDGAESTRLQKLEVIAEWPEAWERLRVCRTSSWRSLDVERGTVENCGRCEKCVRTMLGLLLIGKLERFKTFPPKLTRRSILTMREEHPSFFYTRENLRLALAKRRYDLAAALLGSLFAAHARRLLAPVVRRARRMVRFTGERREWAS